MKKTLFFLLLAPFAHAAVISEPFASYPGSGSQDGWVAGWNNGGVSPSVSSSNPVAGGGSYLSLPTVAFTNPDPPATQVTSANRYIRRELDANVINTTQAYTVTWDFRIDSLTNANWNTFNDRIHFMANNDAATGSSSSASWLIGAVGATSYAGGNWYFYDNNTGAVGDFSTGRLYNTGVALVTGDTYRFTVSTDPANKSYVASVTNLTNITMLAKTTDTATDLGFRNNASTATQHLVMGTSVDPDETRAFSIDSITITGVPEPSTALLGALGALALLRRKR